MPQGCICARGVVNSAMDIEWVAALFAGDGHCNANGGATPGGLKAALRMRDVKAVQATSTVLSPLIGERWTPRAGVISGVPVGISADGYARWHLGGKSAAVVLQTIYPYIADTDKGDQIATALRTTRWSVPGWKSSDDPLMWAGGLFVAEGCCTRAATGRYGAVIGMQDLRAMRKFIQAVDPHVPPRGTFRGINVRESTNKRGTLYLEARVEGKRSLPLLRALLPYLEPSQKYDQALHLLTTEGL